MRTWGNDKLNTGLCGAKSVSKNSGSKNSGVRNLLRDGLDKMVISQSERPRTSSGLLLRHYGDF